jgi:hypothetical protein
MELGSRFTETSVRRLEGREIELFGDAVRQIQTRARNNGAGRACLLHQLRKDFLVEMRRLAIPSSTSQIFYLQ